MLQFKQPLVYALLVAILITAVLQERVDASVILGVVLTNAVIGLLRGESWLDMFMAAFALSVGAIPEGLPAAMTITLAIGVAKLAKRHAIHGDDPRGHGTHS